MSNWRPQIEDDSGAAALLTWLGANYHLLGLLVLFGFVVWNRARTWGNFVVDGTILFSGNDPWYHYRATKYAVEHFPNNIPFDPWTFFSYGTSNSQFGTIFDQTMAFVALVLGLGNPSDELIRQVMLFTPPVLAAVLLVPVYVMGRRVGESRFAGLAAATIVAFSTGLLLDRSLVGFADHQVAEALMQGVAGLGMMVAFSVAQEEKPVYELLAERNVDALRRTVGWSVLGGFAVGLYLWVWPPGILMLGILGVFFLVYLSITYLRGNSPEHVAIAGGIAMATTGVMNLATLSELSFRATGNSLLQPTMAFGLAVWLVFVSWLARTWDERDLNPWGYPTAQVAILAAGVGFVVVAFPQLFERMFSQVVKVLGFILPQSARVGTIGETAPLQFSQLGQLFSWHGLAPLLAVAGILIVLYRQYGADESRAEELFLVVWIAFIFAAVLTQSRFEYYLIGPIAVLSAIPVGMVIREVGSPKGQGVQTWQLMTIALVLMVIIGPMFVFTGQSGRDDPIQDARTGPGNGIVGWEDSLSWMAENTPAVGQYDNSDGRELDYQGTFSRQSDFDYAEGDYGVASWWDYGHWITGVAERIPNANPFQQGATDAARFLLAQNETDAANALARVNEDDAETRYVTVDWMMVESYSPRPIGGKFFAPATFHPNYSSANLRTLEGGDFVQPIILRQPTQIGGLLFRQKQAYYESLVVRLYRYHGSAQAPYAQTPLGTRMYPVVDWEMRNAFDVDRDGQPEEAAVVPTNRPYLRTFPNRSAAESYVADDETSQIGGIGPYPSERVPALEHYRLVKASEMDALANQRRLSFAAFHTVQGANLTQVLAQNRLYRSMPRNRLTNAAIQWLHPTSTAWTKVFERVPGATIRGTAPANTSVTATVPMTIPGGRNFTYTQRTTTGPDGSFSLTVPYSTEGYANWGPETGHTNVSVRARGSYTLRTPRQIQGQNVTYYQATVNVTEGAVIGEEDGPTGVELQKTTRQFGSGGAGDGSSDGSSSSDGGDSTDGGSGGSDGGAGTEGNTSGALRPALDVLAPARAGT